MYTPLSNSVCVIYGRMVFGHVCLNILNILINNLTHTYYMTCDFLLSG